MSSSRFSEATFKVSRISEATLGTFAVYCVPCLLFGAYCIFDGFFSRYLATILKLLVFLVFFGAASSSFKDF